MCCWRSVRIVLHVQYPLDLHAVSGFQEVHGNPGGHDSGGLHIVAHLIVWQDSRTEHLADAAHEGREDEARAVAEEERV